MGHIVVVFFLPVRGFFQELLEVVNIRNPRCQVGVGGSGPEISLENNFVAVVGEHGRETEGLLAGAFRKPGPPSCTRPLHLKSPNPS